MRANKVGLGYEVEKKMEDVRLPLSCRSVAANFTAVLPLNFQLKVRIPAAYSHFAVC